MQNDQTPTTEPQTAATPSVVPPPAPSVPTPPVPAEPVAATPAPTPAPIAPAPEYVPNAPALEANPGQMNTLEYAMFGVAILTISSFLFNNGVLLKVGLIAMLAIAVVSISRSMRSAKNNPPPAAVLSANELQIQQATQKKPTSIFKILGITLAIIILLPVLGYMALVGFIILMFTMGGGNMGT